MQTNSPPRGIKTYVEALNLALYDAMEADPSVFTFGLGAADPGQFFGSTTGLATKFGQKRVFDGPTSENAMTGVAVGAALGGLRPVTHHQRFDFFLLAMDQLVNAAAKWHYMFGGTESVPLVIRLVVGRGWGQGPTHSQNLQSWLAHIPGLRVVIPTFPKDAYGLLRAAIINPNPVVVMEHRWLHNLKGEIAQDGISVNLEKARLVTEGEDVTLVATGDLVLEAMEAAKWLTNEDIAVEVIDLRSVHPIDWSEIFSSVNKTRRLVVCESSHATCSVGSEVISRVCRELYGKLRQPPILLAKPEAPVPTSFGLSQDFYIDSLLIVSTILKTLNMGLPPKNKMTVDHVKHDVPGAWFKGPF